VSGCQGVAAVANAFQLNWLGVLGAFLLVQLKNISKMDFFYP